MNREDLEQMLEEIRSMATEKRRDVSVSSISRCLRESYYSAVMQKEVTVNMVAGHDRHAFFERHFKELLTERGCICEPESEVVIGGVKGRADLVCLCGKQIAVFEFKFTKVPYRLNAYHLFWVRQLRYYVAGVMLDANYADVKGFLVVSSFELDHFFVEEVTVDSPHEVEEEARKRGATLRSALESNEPPPRERGKHCDYCAYRQICFNETLTDNIANV